MPKNLRSFLAGLLFLGFAVLSSGGCGKPVEHKEPVTLVLSSITFSLTLNRGDRDILPDFTKKTGIAVKLLPYGTEDMGARRIQHLAWLKEHAATPDVYEMDIVDVGTLAPYGLNLDPYVPDANQEYMHSILRNLTYQGHLIALPNQTDIGLLFYRTDLLKKYGYKHPPKTWDELEKMAARIQAGERAAGDANFWGFVWEGSPQNEGLTYTALEWQTSNGGGHIIEPDGSITVDNPWAIAAFRRARKWVGTISPPAVTAYQMEDLSNAWLSGRAAFMRNWPYYYSLGQSADSASKGKFDVAPLPAGLEGPAGTLGGWQLLVSAYSAHPKEAVELAKYLSSREIQLRISREFSYMPSRPELYDDPQILQANPYFQWLKGDFEKLAVPRPSGPAGEKYLAVADAYKQSVHKILTGEEDAGEAMAELEQELARITGLPVRHPSNPIPVSPPLSQ